ncbi:hypothetical protein A4G99_19180 [Haladaptatus sp. R4]|uniref:glycoside hydrolase family 2 n=1 Tax=Haladaptatus sp. R4 TaxID=1679489 RepID=UPI0007B49574|nr:glycoside hydrolase family 2 [Haladaptatus sp. R4]KZN22589.1 hypothetical protein A4G99_19180 [Haladaptatus sp. R4]
MSLLNTQTRERTLLDGEWVFLIDREDNGTQQGYQEIDNNWPNEETQKVTVPHSWQGSDAYQDYTGTAWYRTTVDYPNNDGRIFLQFNAVDYEATIYVNGIDVGSHRGGYLPFELEVTDAISSGENTIVVKVNDQEDITEIPHGKQGTPWYTRVSGIWQSVALERRPETFISDMKITPNLENDSATFDIEINENSNAEVKIQVTQGNEAVAESTCDLSSGSGSYTVNLPDPEYWTPENPVIYDVSVSLYIAGLSVDEYCDYFGMRSISHDGDQLYLNEEPLYIRGALDQAYYPDTHYRPLEEDIFESEIRMAKEMGFNLLRKHIKPAHPDFIEAADRQGILVWEEPANPTVYTERSKREVREQLEELVDRDYNSPSVIIWSIYNEEWGIGLDQIDHSDHSSRLWNSEEKQTYLTDLFYDIKDLDPTRLVCDNSGWAHVATDLNDYHEYYVSPDRAVEWGESLDEIAQNPGDNFATENISADEAPMLISEFGTWGLCDIERLRDHYEGDPPWFSHEFLDDPLKRGEGLDKRYESTLLPDVFNGYDELASVWQQRQWDSIKDVIEQMRTHDRIVGYCITEFSDIEWEFNGMLDYFREPKSFVDELPKVNGEVITSIDPDSHVVEPGETITVDIDIVNDSNEHLSGTLRWNAVGDNGSQSVDIDSFGTTKVAEELQIEVPEDVSPNRQKISVTVELEDKIATNEEPLIIIPHEEPGDSIVYAEGDLANRLVAGGITVVENVVDADLALIQSLNSEVESFVKEGGTAVVLPKEDGRMVDNSIFKYRSLPEGESWNLVAALPYQDSELLADISPDHRIGWEFEGLFPHDLVEDINPETDTIQVGHIEGWLANWGSPLLVREFGDGRICSCTFRIASNYGDHPTATLLTNRLLDSL